jgi:cell division cycle 2-like protein
MASKPQSRWADSEEDAALDAKIKREKEEKKRIKAEKARKLEADRQAAEAAAGRKAATDAPATDEENGRPAKRRRLSPERDGSERSGIAPDGGSRLLRFECGGFGPCRSVENYDKLNDIEEGTYGWVARAKELDTGKVVALKRLKLEPKDRGGLPVTGLREIQILKDCEHKNVVKLKEVVVGEDTTKIERLGRSTHHLGLRTELWDMADWRILSAAYSSSSNSSSTTSKAYWRTCRNHS